MAGDMGGNLIKPPADRLHLIFIPLLWQHMCFEHHKQVVRHRPDTEKHGIGRKLTAGHPPGEPLLLRTTGISFGHNSPSAFHAEAQLEFLDAILAVFAAQAIPVHDCYRIIRAVGGDGVIRPFSAFLAQR